MTGKGRINNILHKKSGNTICWTTLIGLPTMIGMPEGVRDLSPLEFYRHVGCDIMLLGCSGLEGVRSPWQLIRTDVEEKSIDNSDGSTSIITNSKWGVLNEIMHNGHPVKYPIETIEDLAVYKNIWLNSYYEESKTDDFEKNMRRGEDLVGDDGVMVNAVAASPVQILLEYGYGINAVTPPHLGDTPFEDVLDCLGEDFIILGGLFNPFQEYNINKEILWKELDKTYTPRIRAANLLLWMGADGQHMPYERFVWVKEWFEKQR